MVGAELNPLRGSLPTSSNNSLWCCSTLFLQLLFLSSCLFWSKADEFSSSDLVGEVSLRFLLVLYDCWVSKAILVSILSNRAFWLSNNFWFSFCIILLNYSCDHLLRSRWFWQHCYLFVANLHMMRSSFICTSYCSIWWEAPSSAPTTDPDDFPNLLGAIDFCMWIL